MANRSKHGREKDEAAWRSTEVDMIHRLHAAGVRVPVPYHFVEDVLLMELVTDADGSPAPRLGDQSFDAHSARVMYDRLIHATMQMLCAGVVHGDLSEFNVLSLDNERVGQGEVRRAQRRVAVPPLRTVKAPA